MVFVDYLWVNLRTPVFMDKFSYLGNADVAQIEALYQAFLQDPDSVDPSWKDFFQGFQFAQSNFESSSAPFPSGRAGEGSGWAGEGSGRAGEGSGKAGAATAKVKGISP